MLLCFYAFMLLCLRIHVSSFFFPCFLWETITLLQLGLTGDKTPQQPSRLMRFAILWFKMSLVMFTRTEMALFQFTLFIVITLLDAG